MDLGEMVQALAYEQSHPVPPYYERTAWLVQSAAALLHKVQEGQPLLHADLERWLSNFELHVCQIDHPDVIDPVAAVHRVRELCREEMTNDTEDGSWTSVDTIWPTDILEALDGRGRWAGVGERVQPPKGTIDGEVTG